jgi:hypothetical protein
MRTFALLKQKKWLKQQLIDPQLSLWQVDRSPYEMLAEPYKDWLSSK